MIKLGLKEIFTEKNAFAVPNWLSLARAFFIPVIVYFISMNKPRSDIIAVILIVLGSSTDYLDGYLARRYQLQSNLGRLLDPLFDKLGVGIIMLFMVIYKALPLWYFLLVIVRDFLIIIAGIYLMKRLHNIKESNLIGKWTVATCVMVIILYIFKFQPYQLIMLWISVIMLILSILLYGKIYYQSVRS